MNLVVVMPAYDAGRHVRAVIDRVAALPNVGRIVVVNDGSRDDTTAKLETARATNSLVDVVHRAANGGYGAAMKDGLDRARELGADVVGCVHADGQYSPEVLPHLVDEMIGRGLDLLQGSRIASGTALAGGMPLYKYVANAVLNRIERRTLRLGMTDFHSGYLVYGRRALALPYRALSESFDFDIELIASARAQGLAIGEAPIPTHYGDEISHLDPVGYGLRVLRVMWKYRRGRYAPA